MKIVKSSFEITDHIDGEAILGKLESAGRTCYKSEDKINSESSRRFLKMLLAQGHESVIEHEKVTVRIICDRGVTHEIVRHRIGSYSQESTRYCNYSAEKFGQEITCILPVFWEDSPELLKRWKQAMVEAERSYFELLAAGAKPEQARSVLPNSLKSEIVVTYNLREWRHFFKLRTSRKSHPQMREIACAMLTDFKSRIPIIFDDISLSGEDDK